MVDVDGAGHAVRRNVAAGMTFAAVMLERRRAHRRVALALRERHVDAPAFLPTLPEADRQESPELPVTRIADVERAPGVRRSQAASDDLPHTPGCDVPAVDVAALDLFIEDRRPFEGDARHDDGPPASGRIEPGPGAGGNQNAVLGHARGGLGGRLARVAVRLRLPDDGARQAGSEFFGVGITRRDDQAGFLRGGDDFRRVAVERRLERKPAVLLRLDAAGQPALPLDSHAAPEVVEIFRARGNGERGADESDVALVGEAFQQPAR